MAPLHVGTGGRPGRSTGSRIKRMLPPPFRTMRSARELAPGRLLHRLLWHLAPARLLQRWADRRLDLGGYYWLFVLGVNNSGTTLLSQILETHPLVRSLPDEGIKLTEALPRAGDFDLNRAWGTRPELFRLTESSDPAPARRVRYDWAYYVPRRPGIILEKTPLSSLRARWLQRHFSPARFVLVVRSPYAVCEGARRRIGLPIEEGARHWARAMECLMEDREHLRNSILVRYEDLCAAPDRELARLEGFLELAPPLDRGRLAGALPAHNVEGVPLPLQDLNAHSLARLSLDEIRTITRLAGSVMRRLGYEPERGGS